MLRRCKANTGASIIFLFCLTGIANNDSAATTATNIGADVKVEDFAWFSKTVYILDENRNVKYNEASSLLSVGIGTKYIQPRKFAYIRLLNKPYENEVTLTDH